MKKSFYSAIFWLVIFYGVSFALNIPAEQIFEKAIEKRPITEMKAVDINKNGIKEIVIVCNYTSPIGKYSIDLGSYGFMKIYEWEGNSLIKKWELSEITKSISTSIVSSGNQEVLQVGTFSLNVLRYKDGKYSLEGINKSIEPQWPNERIFANGSFVKNSSKDIIVTIYAERRNIQIRFRDAKNPSNILWTSPILKKGSGAIVFGDFNKDGKIELLMESGYWVHQDDNSFKIVEIESHKKNKYGTDLPLFKVVGTSDPGIKYFKSGITNNRRDVDIFYLEPSVYPSDFGEHLIKATWIKDKFAYEKILSAKKTAKDGKFTAYNKVDLADIDGDGIDEIIVTEGSGKFVPTEEEPRIEDYKERILMLKWTGQKYETIFATQKFNGNIQTLIDDVTGDGRKDIIVGNAKGEILIFGEK